MRLSSPDMVLVDNLFYRTERGRCVADIVPHLGLMSLAAVLEGAEKRVEIFDPKLLLLLGEWREPDESLMDAAAEHLLSRGAGCIGFTAYGRSLPFVVKVAERVKRRSPETFIVLGGPHPTILGREIVEAFGCVDAVARYEAEPYVTQLLEAAMGRGDLASVPNLVIRRGGRVVCTESTAGWPELDELPRPALHLYPVRELGLTELSLEAGRGCPYACTFCSTANFFRRKYRLKSPRRLVEEMTWAQQTYGIDSFDLNHDLFGLVREHVLEFCELVYGRGMTWRCSVRPDTLDEQMLEFMMEAGCTRLFFGVESGSERLQRVLKKRLNVLSARRRIGAAVRRGIECTVSFVTGFPEETAEDLDQSLDLLGRIVSDDPAGVWPQLHLLSPEPGSELAARGLAVRFDGVSPEGERPLDAALVRDYPAIFSVFGHLESAVARWRSVAASLLVTRVLPVLGWPLTTHIVATVFDGRLSSLVWAAAREADVQGDAEAIVERLWRGVERAVRRRGVLREMVRFSRLLDRTVERRVERFGYAVHRVAAHIVERPIARLPMELTRRNPTRYAIERDGTGGLRITVLTTEGGSDVHVGVEQERF